MIPSLPALEENIVDIVMLILFLGIIIWDVVLALDKERGNTISERLSTFSMGPRLLAVFGLGLLSGHWWW